MALSHAYDYAAGTSAGNPASQQVLRILVGAHLTDDLAKSGPNKELNHEVPKDQAAYCAARRDMHSAADCGKSTEDLWEHVQMPDMAAMVLSTGRSVVHISRSLNGRGATLQSCSLSQLRQPRPGPAPPGWGENEAFVLGFGLCDKLPFEAIVLIRMFLSPRREPKQRECGV